MISKINLYHSSDRKTKLLLEKLERETKIYNAYDEYFFLKELVNMKYQIKSFKHLVSIGADFRRVMLIEELDVKILENHLNVVPSREGIEICFKNKSTFLSNEDMSEELLRENLEQYKLIAVEWNYHIADKIRLLLYVSYILKWSEFIEIVIYNYKKNVSPKLSDEMQMFIKGVLHDYNNEKYIFYPF